MVLVLFHPSSLPTAFLAFPPDACNNPKCIRSVTQMDYGMPLTCPKCRRANPAEANYCFFDGMVLTNGRASGGRLNPAIVAFPMPFVFPSGQSCHNFDQLALACLNNWSMARDLVRQGMLKTFLGGVGRADLAQAADEAARYPDRDRGLAQLLAKLPTKSVPAPRLTVRPMQIDLGVLAIGQERRVELRLANEGLGLIYGSVQCDDNLWLALLNVPVGSNRKLFQFVDEGIIPILVLGQNLRAGNKPLEAKLSIESNAGTQTVVVTASVPVKPFPTGVLAGAQTPRKIAEKAKAAPKEAAALFENGSVQQWYKDNGWTYPVQGPSASGLAAVQQFFEALGLTPPPRVQISVNSLALDGYAGGSLRSSLEVTTTEKRPIYAHASSDQPWLKVGRAQNKGRTVTLPLSVAVVPHCPGTTLTAILTVTANGNQRFEIPVSLAVAQSAAAIGAVPVLDMAEVLSAPGPTSARGAWAAPDATMVAPASELAAAVAQAEPYRPIKPPRRTISAAPIARPVAAPSRLMPLLPIAFILFGLMCTAAHDVYKWLRPDANPIVSGGGGVDSGVPDTRPRIVLAFHDIERKITLGEGGVKPTGNGPVTLGATAFWEPSMRFGLVASDVGVKHSQGETKRLTFEPDGLTNNTVVKLDGLDTWFGERPFRREDGQPASAGVWPGHWRDMKLPLGKDESGRERNGWASVWEYKNAHVIVTQTVEIIPGQSNLLDTCLVRYRISNEDSKKHSVGLRFMLDTYIGANDGVPFLIPGTKSELCDTTKIFATSEEIPDFIQACEYDDLTNLGTVAKIGLKIPGLETPSKVTLGAWPNPELQSRDPAWRECNQEKTKWAVPVVPMKTLTPADSCVVIYWDVKDLAPGENRYVGFSYGLGSVSSGEGKGKLALTAGGAFVPGGTFTVTAYVSNPTAGQTVTLDLPSGYEFASGDATQSVPPVVPGTGSHISPVTWKVRAPPRTGDATLKAHTSTGESQTLPVHIKLQGIFGS